MNKGKEVDSLILTLQELPKVEDIYAIEANITFLKSVKRFITYIKWLILEAPKLDTNKIKELTDFDVSGWSGEMHKKLIIMERSYFPGLIKPLVKKLFNLVENDIHSNIICNIGCGGMEVERQIISKMILGNAKNKPVFLGIDLSGDAVQLAQNNLASLSENIKVIVLERWDFQKFEQIILNRDKNIILVIVCKDNFFNLKGLPEKYFDILFHTLFRHHLDVNTQPIFTKTCSSYSKKIVEYDGYKSWLNMIPQSLIGWSSPMFLNAEIFSNLRFKTKKEIRLMYKDKKLSFYHIGYYMVEL